MLPCGSSRAADSVVSCQAILQNVHLMPAIQSPGPKYVTSSHCLRAPADPLPVDDMYYRRKSNPQNPHWVTVRGTSKLEGTILTLLRLSQAEAMHLTQLAVSLCCSTCNGT